MVDLLEVGVILIVVTGGVEDIPNRTAIVTEGTEVLSAIPGVARARTFPMRLIYALELRHPKNLEHTFKVLWKILPSWRRKPGFSLHRS